MQILYYFYLEISARKTTNELNSNYRLIHRRFMQFRKLIAEYCNKVAKKLNGELEIDEAYLGGKRKGKRGRGANNKAIAFGILERKGKIYTKIVENVSAETLMNEILIKHEKDKFVEGHNHINGIEGFWSFAKERFHKYHGINKTNYPFYLKEMEFRSNHRNESVFNPLFDICIRRRI